MLGVNNVLDEKNVTKIGINDREKNRNCKPHRDLMAAND